MRGASDVFPSVIGKDSKVFYDWVGLVDKADNKENGKNLKEKNLFSLFMEILLEIEFQA